MYIYITYKHLQTRLCLCKCNSSTSQSVNRRPFQIPRRIRAAKVGLTGQDKQRNFEMELDDDGGGGGGGLLSRVTCKCPAVSHRSNFAITVAHYFSARLSARQSRRENNRHMMRRDGGNDGYIFSLPLITFSTADHHRRSSNLHFHWDFDGISRRRPERASARIP